MTTTELRVPAIEIRQGDRRIYSFAVDGKQVHDFAAVSRIRRDPADHLQGYQRPEALAHIRGIRKYLESAGALLPNALVLAFDKRVQFTPTISSGSDVSFAVPGELTIPIDTEEPEHERPAWLVDGQQRAAAIRDANLNVFPVAAVGFIADSEEEQRSQFILVNSTKPLPKGLIHELLPGTTGHLPAALARRQLPAQVMSRLNVPAGDDSAHPFAGRIKSPTAPDGYIQDTTVLKMIEHSLYEGALYQYRNPDGTGDIDAIVAHLETFYSAVYETWPEAWQRPPTKSRLTHGAGIQALGYVMDALTDPDRVRAIDPVTLRSQLALLTPHTAWTSGTWPFRDGERPWNGIEVTSTAVQHLVRHLMRVITSVPGAA